MLILWRFAIGWSFVRATVARSRSRRFHCTPECIIGTLQFFKKLHWF